MQKVSTARCKTIGFLAAVLCFVMASVSPAQEPIVLTLSTNIVVRDVNRFGINFSDAYYSAPVLKKRAEKNYEGMVYRQMVKGILYTNGILSYDATTNQIISNGWADLYTNRAVFELVSGPSRGLTGRISSVSVKMVDVWSKGYSSPFLFYEFDTPVDLGGTNSIRDMGIRIEDLSRITEGYIEATNDGFRVVNATAAADNAPGVFGQSCVELNGTAADAHLILDSMYNSLADVNGVWNFHFWIKNVSGTPGVTVKPTSVMAGYQTNFVPSGTWEKKELLIPVVTNTASMPFFEIHVTGGVVRVDNVVLWKAGYTNPTAFTDDFVDRMRRLNPGTLRFVLMGGNTVSNWIYDPIDRPAGRFAYTMKTGPYYRGENDPPTGFHSLIGLCEYLGIEPWLDIPGCVTPDEVSMFIDYLAGPTNTPGGRIRAELGHPQPWTETVRKIHIEFGNEAWNTFSAYAYAGFNGADFWRELIAAGKGSPSYTNTILFHTAGQNFASSMSARILNDATNSDRYAIAPYMVHTVSTSTFPFAAGDYSAQFKWFMGYPLYEIFEAGMVDQAAVMAQTGVEFSIYEFNYHTVTVSPTNLLPEVNTFMSSICHGLSTANSMLAMLKQYKMRTQTFFTFAQDEYQGVRLWGSTLSMKKDAVRLRPSGLAQEGVNRALYGNLVEAAFSTNPPFSSYGVFDTAPETRTYNSLYSYAFRDGITNRLVLFNYDLTATQTVRMALSDYVKNNTANQWVLSSSAYTNSNERELAAPLVEPSTGTVSFAFGSDITLAPFSMQVLEWEADGALPQLVVPSGSLTVSEGSIAGFNVTLSSQPQTAVTVSVARASGDTDLTVQGGSLLIFNSGNWNTPQTVTLAAAEDADTENGTAIFHLFSSSISSVDVTVSEGENDLGIIVSTNAVVVAENGTNSFQLKLSKDPGVSLTVSVARTSGDTNIAVQSGASLIFNSANWAVNRTVLLVASDDPDVENGMANIACTASGLSVKNISATEADDDTVGLVLTPRYMRVPESGTAAFTVQLSAMPPENSTVRVSRISGDSDLTVSSGAFLVFGASNWSTGQTVTLSATTDLDRQNGEAIFRCEPLFSNSTGSRDVVALETDSGSTPIAFQDGTNGYAGTVDSYLSSISKDSNYGSTGSGYLESSRRPVIAWDLTSLSPTVTVQSADITLNLTQTAGTYTTNSFTITVYALKQPWAEGDGSTGVTWNTTDGTTAWQVSGASGTNDRGALVGTVRVPEPKDANREQVIINLNEAGTAYLQSCISNSAQNFGFIFDNEENSQRRACDLSEASVLSRRPKLVVYYAESTTDRDGDGIPDAWETLYFGGATNASPLAIAANGINTVLECYIAGLNPMDPSAALTLNSLGPLRWNAVSGRVYTIYWTSNLLSGFQTLESNIPWTGNIFTDAVHSADRQGFYRIKVQLQQ